MNLASRIAQLAITRFEIPPSNILGVIAFGSYARKEPKTMKNDVDLILVVRKPSSILEYQEVKIDGMNVDLNVLTCKSLADNLRYADWQRRLCWSVVLDPPKPNANLISWLHVARTLVRLPEASFERQQQLEAILSSFDHLVGDPFTLIVAAAESVITVAQLILEYNGEIPYGVRNLLKAAFEFGGGDLLDCLWSHGFGEPFNIDRTWSDLKAALRQLERIIERAYPAHIGEGERLAANVSAERLRPLREEIRHWCTTHCWSEALSADLKVLWDSVPKMSKQSVDGYGRQEVPRLSTILKTSDIYIQEEVPRLVDYNAERQRLKVILRTGGCRVPTCVFCELPYISRPGVIKRQLASISYDGPIEELSVYTDGSLFDEQEVAPADLDLIAEWIRGVGPRRLIVESLPRFVPSLTVCRFLDQLQSRIEVVLAFGLQSCDTQVRKILGTPISDSDLVRLFRWRDRYPAMLLRCYLLVGKPFMTPDEDLHDLIYSGKYLQKRLKPGDWVTLNPLIAAPNSLVHRFAQQAFVRYPDTCYLRRAADKFTSEVLSLTTDVGSLSGATCASIPPEDTSGCNYCRLWLKRGVAPLCSRSEECCYPPWHVVSDLRSRAIAVRRLIEKVQSMFENGCPTKSG